MRRGGEQIPLSKIDFTLYNSESRLQYLKAQKNEEDLRKQYAEAQRLTQLTQIQYAEEILVLRTAEFKLHHPETELPSFTHPAINYPLHTPTLEFFKDLYSRRREIKRQNAEISKAKHLVWTPNPQTLARELILIPDLAPYKPTSTETIAATEAKRRKTEQQLSNPVGR